MPKFDEAVIVDPDGTLHCRMSSPLLRVMALEIAALFDRPLIGRDRITDALNDAPLLGRRREELAAMLGGMDQFGVVQPVRTAGTTDIAYPIGWEPE
jgi:hypothetical protein